MMRHESMNACVNQGCNSMQKFSENAEKWTCQVQIFMIFIFRVTFLKLYAKIIILSELRSE